MMGWDGNGTFTRGNGTNSGSTTWADDLADGTKITASNHDIHDEDLSDGINACITQNNENKPTADFDPNSASSYSFGDSTNLWLNYYASGDLVLKERADHSVTPAASFGQFWVKNDAPCAPYFTNDAGTDFNLLAHARKGYLYGLGTALDVDTDHDVLINVGECLDSGNAIIMPLTSILTKRIDADWAAGDDAGGLATGARAVADTPDADDTYHYFLIMHANGTVDAGWDTSTTATNLLSDSGYTYYRRIASHLIDASNNITGYTQRNREFLLLVPVLSINDTAPGTSANSYAMTAPTDIQVGALIHATMTHNTTGTQALITSLDQTDTAPSTSLYTFRSNGNAVFSSVSMEVRTNTSAQIRYRQTDASADIDIVTNGWIDDLDVAA